MSKFDDITKMRIKELQELEGKDYYRESRISTEKPQTTERRERVLPAIIKKVFDFFSYLSDNSEYERQFAEREARYAAYPWLREEESREEEKLSYVLEQMDYSFAADERDAAEAAAEWFNSSDDY